MRQQGLVCSQLHLHLGWYFCIALDGTFIVNTLLLCIAILKYCIQSQVQTCTAVHKALKLRMILLVLFGTFQYFGNLLVLQWYFCELALQWYFLALCGTCEHSGTFLRTFWHFMVLGALQCSYILFSVRFQTNSNSVWKKILKIL